MTLATASGSPLSILLCSAEPQRLQLLEAGLKQQSMLVTVEADPGLLGGNARHFDAVVMEVHGSDALKQCEQLRQRSTVPILLVCAQWDNETSIAALEAGADDCLPMSIDARMLIARLHVLMRRWRGWAKAARTQVKVGPLLLDLGTQTAWLEGRELLLTGYEFGLLRVLAERSGQVLGREELMELVKGNSEEAFDRSIDVHVCRIRAKLGADFRHRRLLRTVRGIGYLLTPTGMPEESGSSIEPARASG